MQRGHKYGQYSEPGVTDDLFFGAGQTQPGKEPTDYGYHKVDFGSGAYFVKDGYQLIDGKSGIAAVPAS